MYKYTVGKQKQALCQKAEARWAGTQINFGTDRRKVLKLVIPPFQVTRFQMTYAKDFNQDQ